MEDADFTMGDNGIFGFIRSGPENVISLFFLNGLMSGFMGI